MSDPVKVEKTVIVEEPAPHRFLAERFAVMHRWWSVRIGMLGVLLLAGMPALEDQIPALHDVLLGWFPRNGAQWVPMLCIVLTVVARVLSQAAVIDQLRSLFRKKGGGDGPQ